MQDGATSHTSANSKLFLQKRCSFLSFWPSNSPDLNPIEHLWGAIKKIIQNRIFNTKLELFNFISQIWDEFPQNKIDELCLSFNSRLKTVINSNGKSITDILRSSIENDSPIVLENPEDLLTTDELITRYDPLVNDQPISYLTRRKYTDEEDILLLTLKNQSERITYEKMAEMFVDRTPASLKKRYYYLTKV